uniref:subtilisin n=1 Tax=Chromera velia CCMP2878 TaxID=1169474 RepID=A0A0G4H6F5_9ALVE|eukprot:Cvel_24873.t1-p1 / transcript=Cvel_24873.t1 / gene=Cvel_24873 / organism=Chromera_velia_CCMP2878 / gene_product=Thermitase, putative / transcript_product=Thermitase, putative / location=Cvel_scaffold2748:14430-17590(+) / protein_length=764 / sequence_SO=supercontig / SO=protein_coding / is_pseudo=false
MTLGRGLLALFLLLCPTSSVSEVSSTYLSDSDADGGSKRRLIVSWVHEEGGNTAGKMGEVAEPSDLYRALSALRESPRSPVSVSAGRRLKATELPDTHAAILKRVRSVEHLDIMGIDVVDMEDEESKEELMKRLKAYPDVDFVEEDQEVYIDPPIFEPEKNRREVQKRVNKTESGHERSLLSEHVNLRYVPNDPHLGQQWNLDHEGELDIRGSFAFEAWARLSAFLDADAEEQSPILVGVADTGVRWNHEDLRAVMWRNEKEVNGQPGVDDDGNGLVDDVYGGDFIDGRDLGINDDSTLDPRGHGTHCAGIIGATRKNGKGVAGVANPRIVRIVDLRFINEYDRGYSSDAARATEYGLKMGVRVFSNSWRTRRGDVGTIRRAVQKTYESGALFIAAAGNDRQDIKHRTSWSPLALQPDVPNILLVASTDESVGDLSGFSNYGSDVVQIAAPGSSIYSTYRPNSNSYTSISGTSMAAPAVTGAAVMLMAFADRLTKHMGIPTATGMEVKRALLDGARRGGGLFLLLSRLRGCVRIRPSIRECAGTDRHVSLLLMRQDYIPRPASRNQHPPPASPVSPPVPVTGPVTSPSSEGESESESGSEREAGKERGDERERGSEEESERGKERESAGDEDVDEIDREKDRGATVVEEKEGFPVLIVVLASVCGVTAVAAFAVSIWWIMNTQSSVPVESGGKGALSVGGGSASSASEGEGGGKPQWRRAVTDSVVARQQTNQGSPPREAWSLPQARKSGVLFKRGASLLNDVA